VRKLHAHSCHLILAELHIRGEEVGFEKVSRESLHRRLAKEEESFSQDTTSRFGQVTLDRRDQLLTHATVILVL